VAHCIDQGDLVESIYPSGTLIATQFLPSNTFGFTPGLLWHEHNTDLAASLLATAGYTGGLTVTLSLADTPTDYLPEPRQIAEAIQLQLAECSITVDIELLDPDTYADASVDGQFGLFLSGWSADYPGPIGFLNYHFGGAGGDRQFGSPFPEIAERLESLALPSPRSQSGWSRPLALPTGRSARSFTTK
jgi:peptide/nickel transport system substrate-binding protein